MIDATTNNRLCRSETLAAYLDSELDATTRQHFEQHLKGCQRCTAQLEDQRRLLCTLDSALGDNPALEIPKNFAGIVAARAQSNMSGIRGRTERGQALRLCMALAAASLALLGGAAISESVLAPITVIARHTISVFGFLGHALYNIGAGVAVISRGVGGHLIFESHLLGWLVPLLLVLAIALLPRLIAGYHRARSTE